VQGSAVAGQEVSAPFVGRRYRWWADPDGNAAAVCRGDVSLLRTKAGEHEVDLIVETVDGGVLGIEVKLASTVDDNDMRHVLWLREQVPEQVVDLVVITTGPVIYRRADGVEVNPLALLGP